MRVAGFMSGSGTNLVKILDYERRLLEIEGKSPFQVVLVFTDNAESKAREIADQYSLAIVTRDIMEFYRARGHENKRDMSLRPEYDRETVWVLAPHEIDTIALAGYMSIVTDPLLGAWPGRIVNVHPADLTVRDGRSRRYVGDHAVRDAIRAGERALRSTTHVVRREVDYGEILMLSAPVEVVLPRGWGLLDPGKPENAERLRTVADEHQDRLKEAGDWVIFPRTLEMMAQGRYAFDDAGLLHVDGDSAPGGVRLEGNE